MKYLIGLTIFSILISGCNSDSPEITVNENDFIVAGEINQNGYASFNDTIIANYYGQNSVSIDINNDYVNDIILYSGFNFYFGGTLNRFWSTIRSVNKTEILTDSTQKEFVVQTYSQFSSNGSVTYDTKNYFDNEFSPQIINIGDSITNKGFWTTDTLMYLCSETPYPVFYNDSILKIVTEYFHGWNDLGNKFIGYRYFSENDTLYGWLEIKIENFNKVYLYQTSHK